jgi:hypothetical protein
MLGIALAACNATKRISLRLELVYYSRLTFNCSVAVLISFMALIYLRFRSPVSVKATALGIVATFRATAS